MIVLDTTGGWQTDDCRHLDDETAIPATGAVTVSLARWEKEIESLVARGDVGVRIENTVDVLQHADSITQAPRIVLSFPGFADGRAYSQAALLRQRLNYRGELRASGDVVVRDQLHNMLRSGFDAFALRDDQNPESCAKAISDFSMAYQPAADKTTIVRRLRFTN